MTHCFPPLSALMRPEPPMENPVTANTADTTAAGELRARCPATHPILNAPGTLTCDLPAGHPGVPAEIHHDPVHGGWCERSDAAADEAQPRSNTEQLLARIAEATEAVVDHLGWAVREREAKAAAAAQAPARTDPDLMLDNEGDVWIRRHAGGFHCVTANLSGDRTADDVRETYGPVHEYDLRPSRRGT